MKRKLKAAHLGTLAILTLLGAGASLAQDQLIQVQPQSTQDLVPVWVEKQLEDGSYEVRTLKVNNEQVSANQSIDTVRYLVMYVPLEVSYRSDLGTVYGLGFVLPSDFDSSEFKSKNRDYNYITIHGGLGGLGGYASIGVGQTRTDFLHYDVNLEYARLKEKLQDSEYMDQVGFTVRGRALILEGMVGSFYNMQTQKTDFVAGIGLRGSLLDFIVTLMALTGNLPH